MRDAASQHLRDQSERVRTWIKENKKKTLAAEARVQFQAGTFQSRKILTMFDGGSGAGGIGSYALDAGITVLVGCDISDERVDEAHAMYDELTRHVVVDKTRKRRLVGAPADMLAFYASTPPALFVSITTMDAFAADTHETVSVVAPYDIMTYFNTLHYAASSRELLEDQFRFWSTALTPTGSVIIQTVDADKLGRYLTAAWNAVSASGVLSDEHEAAYTTPTELHVKNAFFTLTWPANTPIGPLRTGLPYTFSFLASMEDTPEYCIHPHDVHRFAEKYGFDVVQQSNLADDNPHAFRSLDKDEKEVIALYCTYILRRKTHGR
jgi:hypothetical protein